jgi:peptidoglycan hydrolase-like protein with peptidoglycan-binding domain
MSGSRLPRAIAALSAWLACAGVGCAQALAQTASTGSGPTALAAPAPGSPPVSGHIRLALEGAGGSPRFVIAGRRILLSATVVPYVARQRVKVSVYRDGRMVEARLLRVLPLGRGEGHLSLTYSSRTAGLVQMRVVHDPTAQLGAFAARSQSVLFAWPDLGPGARGPSVRLLQAELGRLHYAVPTGGVFDEATGRAVTAYRKLAGLERLSSTNTGVFELLQRGVGGFRVRYRRDGRHVEADLTSQVLAEIEAGGRVRSIYTMSSGKVSTPTVTGRFRVYSKTPGVNEKGMVDSNYFIAGYAIHGYAEVPTFAASHGCLRVPIPDAASIYSWARLGTPVDVYEDGGGGSRRVSGRAGP